MTIVVVHQRFGELLRRRDSEVGRKVPMRGSGMIKVDYFARKIGAVAEEKVEMAPVALRVESGDELSVLAGRRVKFKHVDLPVIGGAYKLGPVTLRHGGIGRIRSNVAQLCAPIFISKGSANNILKQSL